MTKVKRTNQSGKKTNAIKEETLNDSAIPHVEIQIGLHEVDLAIDDLENFAIKVESSVSGDSPPVADKDLPEQQPLATLLETASDNLVRKTDRIRMITSRLDKLLFNSPL